MLIKSQERNLQWRPLSLRSLTMLRHTPLVKVNQANVSLVIIDNSDQKSKERNLQWRPLSLLLLLGMKQQHNIYYQIIEILSHLLNPRSEQTPADLVT